jgi:hypothetical protein
METEISKNVDTATNIWTYIVPRHRKAPQKGSWNSFPYTVNRSKRHDSCFVWPLTLMVRNHISRDADSWPGSWESSTELNFVLQCAKKYKYEIDVTTQGWMFVMQIIVSNSLIILSRVTAMFTLLLNMKRVATGGCVLLLSCFASILKEEQTHRLH